MPGSFHKLRKPSQVFLRVAITGLIITAARPKPCRCTPELISKCMGRCMSYAEYDMVSCFQTVTHYEELLCTRHLQCTMQPRPSLHVWSPYWHAPSNLMPSIQQQAACASACKYDIWWPFNDFNASCLLMAKGKCF